MFLLDLLSPLISVCSGRSAKPTTRRQSRRYKAGEKIRCELCLPDGTFPAQVIDVSPQGVGLKIKRWATEGMEAKLRLSSQDCLWGHDVPLKIVRCKFDEQGHCQIGATFDNPLDSETLQMLFR